MCVKFNRLWIAFDLSYCIIDDRHKVSMDSSRGPHVDHFANRCYFPTYSECMFIFQLIEREREWENMIFFAWASTSKTRIHTPTPSVCIENDSDNSRSNLAILSCGETTAKMHEIKPTNSPDALIHTHTHTQNAPEK